MKNIKSKLTGWAAVAVAALLLPSVGRAQGNDNIYLNIDWQYNVPLGASFADKSSGWGMNFEGGYYFPNNFGVGAFIAYHTNNEYIPRQTFPVGETSTVTTDQQHSVFQLPFGATGRYRFLQTNVLEPYVALKLGAKYAANCMLATRISFINDIANLCELVGADIHMVRKGIGSDPRIGSKFLYPGCGYGGSCFPKDVKALIHTAEQRGYRMQVLHAVESVNQQQKRVLFDKLMRYFGGDLTGKRIAMWGVAFKPQTDDIREAPSLVLIDLILRAGGRITVYDPVAMDECRRVVGDKVAYAKDMYEAVVDADALLLVTEWKEFRIPSWPVIERTMRCPALFDGRNIYDKHEFDGTSIVYHYIGG